MYNDMDSQSEVSRVDKSCQLGVSLGWDRGLSSKEPALNHALVKEARSRALNIWIATWVKKIWC